VASRLQTGRQPDKGEDGHDGSRAAPEVAPKGCNASKPDAEQSKQNFQESVDPVEREIVDNQLYREATRA
jgi:hypothetical protein